MDNSPPACTYYIISELCHSSITGSPFWNNATPTHFNSMDEANWYINYLRFVKGRIAEFRVIEVKESTLP